MKFSADEGCLPEPVRNWRQLLGLEESEDHCFRVRLKKSGVKRGEAPILIGALFHAERE
jgi:hypothetical protein